MADPAALCLLAQRYLPRLRVEEHPFKYRCILVDEVQDFGSVELTLVAAVAPNLPDSMLLAGDRQQRVFPKHQDMSAAGIDVVRRRYFRKNFRNTRQILEAGVVLVETFGEPNLDAEGESVEMQSPEFSVRESGLPLVVEAASEDEEMLFVSSYVRRKREIDQLPVCVVACGIREDDDTSLRRLGERYAERGLTSELLTRESRMLPGAVFLSPLEDVKGFEFSLVIVTRCSAELMPDAELPADESWRDARRLYVALTRARDEVVFTFHGRVSRFLEGIRNHLKWKKAAEEMHVAV